MPHSLSHRKIRQYFLESPGCRTVFSGIIPLVAGVLSGTFVLEITTPLGLDWSIFYKTGSFYGLLILSLAIYFYNRALYLYERDIQRFMDADYCIAYMRSKCLPEAADRYRELIRNGVGGELAQAMEELRKILR